MRIKKILFILYLMLLLLLINSTFVIGVEERQVIITNATKVLSPLENRPYSIVYTFTTNITPPSGTTFKKQITTYPKLSKIVQNRTCSLEGYYYYEAKGAIYFTENDVQYKVSYNVTVKVTHLAGHHYKEGKCIECGLGCQHNSLTEVRTETKAATCTSPKLELRYRECRNGCGVKFDEDGNIPAKWEEIGSPLGHYYEGGTCQRCGDIYEEGDVGEGPDTEQKPVVCNHTYTDATCTEPKKCRWCGITEGAALGHTWLNGVCTRCGELQTEGVLNKWSLDNPKNPTGTVAELLTDGTLIIYSEISEDKEYAIADYQHPTFGDKEKMCPITGRERIKKVHFKGNPTNIGSYLFYYCNNIEEVIIDNPEGIQYIGSGAFFGCKNLKEFTIPENVTMIGARAFCHCHVLETLDFSNAKGLLRIGHEVARDCYSLENVKLPEGLKVIGYEAFLNCISLKNVFIPTTVVAMGTKGDDINETGLGVSTQLTDVEKEQGNTTGYNNIFTVDFSRNKGQTEYKGFIKRVLEKNSVTYNETTSLQDITELLTKTRVWYYSTCSIAKTYDAQQAATEMEISELRWDISNSKDYGDNVIATLDINGKLTIEGNGQIKDYSEGKTPWFEVRDKIKNVEIKEGITKVGSYLFYNHANTTTITLTNTITSIGEKAFFNCTSLTSIMIPWGTYIEKDSNAFGVDKEGNCAKLVISYYEDSEMMSAYANNPENKIANREYRTIKVKSIEVKEPYETNYYENELLNTENLVMEVTYENDFVHEFLGDNDNVRYSKTILDTVGENTITIDYYNKTTNIKVNVSHKFDKGVETKKATCTEDGVKTYTCTECKETKTNTIPKLGHDFSEEYTTDKKATCKEAGSESRHCTRTGCNEKTDVRVIPATGNHTWDNGVTTKPATCTEDGVKTYTCTECRETKTESIEKTGHNFEDGKCTNCGEELPKVEVESDEYTVDSLKYYISSIQPETTVREFKQKLETNATKKELFNDKKAVGEDELVVTGMKLKLSLNDEVVEFTLIVKGDVNSDGYADFKDIATINKHRLGKNTIQEVYLLRAANVEEDEEVDFKDIVKINKFRLEKITKL